MIDARVVLSTAKAFETFLTGANDQNADQTEPNIRQTDLGS